MHSLDLAPFTAEFGDYRHLQLREAASGITLVPGGAWFTRDPQTVSERSEDVSVAWGHGPDLEVVRPLKGGGAHRYHYEKFTLKGVDTLSEARYREAKTKVDKLLTQR